MNKPDPVKLADAIKNYYHEIKNLYDEKPSVRYLHREGTLSYSIIRSSNSKIIVEIGSGWSTYYLGLAAKKNNGEVISIDINQDNVRPFLDKLNDLPVILIKDDAYKNMDKYIKDYTIIDYFFHDGDHTREAANWYIDFVAPHVKRFIAIHDVHIRPPQGVVENDESKVVKQRLGSLLTSTEEVYKAGNIDFICPNEDYINSSNSTVFIRGKI